MRLGAYVGAALAGAIVLTGTACGKTDSEATATTSPASTTTGTSVDSAQLPSLVPAPADTQTTKGPDSIPNNGIRLHYQVNGAPNDVLNAFKAALESKGWVVTTIVTSDGPGGGGGATYTGTNGSAYGVFDGGGYNSTTYLDVCAWPEQPANPNCTRGDR